MKEKILKIDIHAHITAYPDASPLLPPSRKRMVSEEELLGLYDEVGIEAGVLLPSVSPEKHDEPFTSGDCQAASLRHPGRFFWFCGMDPRMFGNKPTTDFSEPLEHYKALGAKGVGELTANLPADDPLVDNLFYHCAACDMPVTIHLAPYGVPYGYYGIQDEVGLPRLEKMLKKHKNLKILGHSQAFWAELSDDVTEENRTGYPRGKVREGWVPELMRRYENLYCDLSANSGRNAFMRDREYAARFIEEFPDRILYGCDVSQSGNDEYVRVFSAWLEDFRADGMISAENYYKLVRGNAERLLKLKDD